MPLFCFTVSDDFILRKQWAEVIYEEAEKVDDKHALEVVRLLRDKMIKNSNESPEEVRWLWKEQIALLNTLLRSE